MHILKGYAMAGSNPRQYVMNKGTALNLLRILENLTVERVGNRDDFHFVAAVASEISEKFYGPSIPSGEPMRGPTVSEAGIGSYGRKLYG